MSNKNLVSATISEEFKTEIRQAVETIKARLPFLINLTDKERRGGMKLGDKSVAFVDKVVSYTQAKPQYVPPFLDLAELTRDYQLTKDLQDIVRVLAPLVQSIEDTTTEAGMEAISSAMVYYRVVRDAASRGEDGAQAVYDDLQKRFPGSAGNGSSTTTTTTASTKTA